MKKTAVVSAMSEIEPLAAVTEGVARCGSLHSPRSRWLLPYVVVVVAAGATMILATLPGLPQHRWAELVLFILVAAAAEFWTVPATAEGGVSLCFVITYTAAILFGPCFGALTACAGGLAYGVVRRRFADVSPACLAVVSWTRLCCTVRVSGRPRCSTVFARRRP